MKEYTTSQFNALQTIYSYFNEKLFDSQLNNCLLNFSRKSKSMGFFAPERWGVIEDKSKVHEISLNPDHLELGYKETLQTLVHEMCHLWQQDFGKPSPGYHNQEWAEKMKSVGLQPSSTGHEGGKETGKNMSDYVIEGGLFDTALAAMPEDYLYPLISFSMQQRKAAKPNKNKTKYTCPSCEANIWGKDGLIVTCNECDEYFVKAEKKAA